MKGQRADTFLHHHGLQDAFSKNISFDDPQNGVIFHVENRSRMKGPPQSLPPHVQWAHDEVDLLCTSDSHSSSCIDLFHLGSLFLR